MRQESVGNAETVSSQRLEQPGAVAKRQRSRGARTSAGKKCTRGWCPLCLPSLGWGKLSSHAVRRRGLEKHEAGGTSTAVCQLHSQPRKPEGCCKGRWGGSRAAGQHQQWRRQCRHF